MAESKLILEEEKNSSLDVNEVLGKRLHDSLEELRKSGEWKGLIEVLSETNDKDKIDNIMSNLYLVGFNTALAIINNAFAGATVNESKK